MHCQILLGGECPRFINEAKVEEISHVKLVVDRIMNALEHWDEDIVH